MECGQDHGHAVATQVLDDAPGGLPGLWIQSGGRLVEEDQLGSTEQRQCQRESLLLAAGQSPVRRRGDGGQSDEVEQCLRIVRMGGNDAYCLSVSRGRAAAAMPPSCSMTPTRASELTVARIEAEHAYRPRVRRAVTLADLHRGRLAGAVGTEDRGDVTRDMSSETPSMAGRSRYRLTRSTTSTAGVVTCGV